MSKKVVKSEERLRVLIDAEDCYLTIRDVTVLTGLGRATVYRRIGSGDIPVVRLGGTIRVSKRSLLATLKEMETRTPSAA
ncbi:MAG: helix-turn-helix domain-containing protein [Bryobacterales bacterium]|nr:helix-turn-helix domain-containing protein [Bryobacterales bacterium]